MGTHCKDRVTKAGPGAEGSLHRDPMQRLLCCGAEQPVLVQPCCCWLYMQGVEHARHTRLGHIISKAVRG